MTRATMRGIICTWAALVLIALPGAEGPPLAARNPVAELPRAALLIGISDYGSETIPDLANPRNDVRVMNSSLSELGFGVTVLEDGDVTDMRAVVDRMEESFPAGGVSFTAGGWANVDIGEYDDPNDDLSESGGLSGILP